VKRTAVLSVCGGFRYLLTREWAEGERVLTFVMLNPSTADGERDDATVRKCIGFARNLGFGGIRIANLFAYRARDPKELRRAGWPPGLENNYWSKRIALWAYANNEPIVCAWGAHARGHAGQRRVAEVMDLMQRQCVDLRALLVLADGTPGHPLMLPYSCTLQPFGEPARA
jgi:hypothetical protein